MHFVLFSFSGASHTELWERSTTIGWMKLHHVDLAVLPRKRVLQFYDLSVVLVDLILDFLDLGGQIGVPLGLEILELFPVESKPLLSLSNSVNHLKWLVFLLYQGSTRLLV